MTFIAYLRLVVPGRRDILPPARAGAFRTGAFLAAGFAAVALMPVLLAVVRPVRDTGALRLAPIIDPEAFNLGDPAAAFRTMALPFGESVRFLTAFAALVVFLMGFAIVFLATFL